MLSHKQKLIIDILCDLKICETCRFCRRNGKEDYIHSEKICPNKIRKCFFCGSEEHSGLVCPKFVKKN